MSPQAIAYYAKKFFPHLLETHAIKLVMELIEIDARCNRDKIELVLAS